MKRYLRVLLNDGVSVIVLGVLLRLMVMPFTLNWDLWMNTRLAALLSGGGFGELYSAGGVAYPPLTYMVLNLYLRVLGPLVGGGFSEWLKLGDLSALTWPYLFRYLFLLKVPMVVSEVVTGIMVARMFSGKWRQRVLLGWMLNPVIIYLVAGFANVDAFPVLCLVLVMWLLKKERLVLGAGVLGVAVALKLFPVFLFPFLLVWKDSWRERAKNVAAFVLPVIIAHLPVLGLASYGSGVVTGSNSQTIFFSSITVGLERFLIYYVFLYALVWFGFIASGRGFNDLIQSWFLVLALMFVVSAFHVQWFYWLMPFLVGYFVAARGSGWVMITLMGSYVMLVLVKEASLHVGMLAPIETTLWFLARPADSVLGERVGFYLGVFHSLVAASLMWMGYELISKKVKLIG